MWPDTTLARQAKKMWVTPKALEEATVDEWRQTYNRRQEKEADQLSKCRPARQFLLHSPFQNLLWIRDRSSLSHA